MLRTSADLGEEVEQSLRREEGFRKFDSGRQ